MARVKLRDCRPETSGKKRNITRQMLARPIKPIMIAPVKAVLVDDGKGGRKLELVNNSAPTITMREMLIEKAKQALSNISNKEPLLKKNSSGYTEISKTKMGVSLRQMYLEEKGYDFDK